MDQWASERSGRPICIPPCFSSRSQMLHFYVLASDAGSFPRWTLFCFWRGGGGGEQATEGWVTPSNCSRLSFPLRLSFLWNVPAAHLRSVVVGQTVAGRGRGCGSGMTVPSVTRWWRCVWSARGGWRRCVVPCGPLRTQPAAATVVGVSAVSSAALQVAHDDGGLHGVLAITALLSCLSRVRLRCTLRPFRGSVVGTRCSMGGSKQALSTFCGVCEHVIVGIKTIPPPPPPPPPPPLLNSTNKRGLGIGGRCEGIRLDCLGLSVAKLSIPSRLFLS